MNKTLKQHIMLNKYKYIHKLYTASYELIFYNDIECIFNNYLMFT